MRIQPGPGEPDHDYELPSFTACAALDCRESEVCRNFDACLAIDGACQVAPKREVTCKTKRILGLKAEATSTHPPEERDIFDATYAVDRDLRTAWAPEARDATTAILTIRLPKAERVARVLIKAGLWLDYAHMDWSAFFTQPYAILVRVGDRHEIAYAHWRWATDRWLEVTLPPTTSDTITLQTLFHGTPILSEAPAITDVKVEACE